ncbi:aquaporin-11-like [Pelobates cultripes]|uniref:Aquaporin n=1 Tax=Pelobates cultripes TaxID=61616 RepID=A0AAD1R8E6_PELCU|nr:aquaporin-11-like [Pelobates cultripes]
MEVLWGSALLMAVIVLLCEGLRSLLPRKLHGLHLELAFEAVSTVQLCCCTWELVLLGVRGGLDPLLSLGLTYLMTVIHCLSLRAACNPCGSLQLWLRKEASGVDTTLRLVAQFAGAALSRLVMPFFWKLRLSHLHEDWKAEDFRSPLSIGPLSGAGVEMLSALCLLILLRNLGKVEEQFRPHVVAMLITGLVYAGGHLTGAVFNPALAFSVLLSCEGNTFLEYAFVYWLGPVIGLILSILLLDGCIPKLSSDEKIASQKKLT